MLVKTAVGGIVSLIITVSAIAFIVSLGCWGDIEMVSDEFSNCHRIPNCSEPTTCIRDYVGLESYILSNKTVLHEIKRAFFSTGQVPSSFVRISYEFHVLDSTTGILVENVTNNCYKHQEFYFWSSSPLLLFGPQPLLYLTLFAVNVPEQAVTIQLPGLCNDTYNDFLSELTYRVNIIKCLH